MTAINAFSFLNATWSVVAIPAVYWPWGKKQANFFLFVLFLHVGAYGGQSEIKSGPSKRGQQYQFRLYHV